MKLFCIPYAGGSSLSYAQWIHSLDSNIELITEELAGRGRRLHDPHYKDFNEMITDIHQLILKHITANAEAPFAIYGHSMGGYIAYQLYSKLKEYNLKHLFISGARAPHLGIVPTNHNSDKDIIAKIRKLGGTPQELLNNTEFLNLVLPILRADFRNLDNYSFEKIQIHVPTTILHGLYDECDLEDLYEWNEYFAEKPTMHFFEGGHFFIKKFEKEVIAIINQTLRV